MKNLFIECCSCQIKVKIKDGKGTCEECGVIYEDFKRDYSTLSKDKFYTDKTEKERYIPEAYTPKE